MTSVGRETRLDIVAYDGGGRLVAVRVVVQVVVDVVKMGGNRESYAYKVTYYLLFTVRNSVIRKSPLASAWVLLP